MACASNSFAWYVVTTPRSATMHRPRPAAMYATSQVSLWNELRLVRTAVFHPCELAIVRVDAVVAEVNAFGGMCVPSFA